MTLAITPAMFLLSVVFTLVGFALLVILFAAVQSFLERGLKPPEDRP